MASQKFYLWAPNQSPVPKTCRTLRQHCVDPWRLGEGDGVSVGSGLEAGETQPKLQKRAFSAYEHKHWILMRAERAGALPGHARSALAGHRTRGAR